MKKFDGEVRAMPRKQFKAVIFMDHFFVSTNFIYANVFMYLVCDKKCLRIYSQK